MPSFGGTLTVTATVTNPSDYYPAMQAFLYEDGATGSNYNTSVILNTSDGATYTGSFSIGPNPDYSGHTWTVSVVATDGAGISKTITASPCTQGAFSFTGVSISPASLPSSGGTLTVTATVTNPSDYYPTMQAFLYEDGATGSNYVTSVTLSTSDGATYTGSFNIPANNTNDYIDYSVTVVATDESGVTHTITSGLCRQATSQNQPVPTLTAISPTSGFADTNITLTLTGTNFGYRSVVMFGGATVIPSSVSATKLVATIPAADVTPVGTVTVTVLNDGPAGGTSAGKTFTVLAPVASVSLNPAAVTGGTSSTGTVTLTANAPLTETITLKSGTTSVATVPASVTVAAGAKTATFTVTTVQVGSVNTVTISATGGVTKSATLTVNPPAPTSLTLDPASLIGGASSTGTVTLASAPTVNETVALTSGNNAATVPASVTVTAGHTTATFTVTTTSVTATTSAVITATAGGVSKTATLTINPAPMPKTLTLSPTSVTGGSNSTATVTLTADTPTDLSVNLASNNASAAVPPTATVPAGTDSITFDVVTSSVTTTQTAAITATANGGSASGTLTITPAAGAPTVTSFTPTSGPIGTVVTVTGTNLNGVTAVRFHNANATTFSANAAGTQLTVTVPTGAGTGTFTITTPAGSVKTTGTFTVVAPPTVTSFTPTSGPIGTVVTVTGTNLNGVTAVRFHNANATTFSANAAGTQLTVTVPTGAGTGTFTITTPAGSVKTTGTFTVN